MAPGAQFPSPPILGSFPRPRTASRGPNRGLQEHPLHLGPGLTALSRSHRWPRPSTDHRLTLIHKIHQPRVGIVPSSSSSTLSDFLVGWPLTSLANLAQARCCLCFTAVQRDPSLAFPGKSHDINITYIENSKNSTQKLLGLINKFSKVAG